MGAVKSARRRERGAAVFVVVMVITLLTAVGMFAARSATLVDTAAGYNRQSLQAHYLAELAVLGMATELGTTAVDAYIGQMNQGKDSCRATRHVTPLVDGAVVPCYKVYLSELKQRAKGQQLLDYPQTGPNSLGPFSPDSGLALQGNFVVEMTEPGPAPILPAGAPAGDSGAGTEFEYIQVVLTATGQVHPFTNTACDERSTTVTGLESMRAHVTIGPLKKQ
jgi:hypothetical protein